MSELSGNQDDIEFVRNIARNYAALVGNNAFTGNNTFAGTSIFSGAATLNGGLSTTSIVASGGAAIGGLVTPLGIANLRQATAIVPHAAAGAGATATFLNTDPDDDSNPPVKWYSGDWAGTIQLVMGTVPTANGVLFTASYAQLDGDLPTPRVLIWPADKVTINGTWGATKTPIPDPFSNGFSVLSNDTPLAASTTFTWHYLISN